MAEYRRERPRSHLAAVGSPVFYQDRGRFGRVFQGVAIESKASWKPGTPSGATMIWIDETPFDFGPLPRKWFREAIAPNPPAPLLPVPFWKGKFDETVEPTTLFELEFGQHGPPSSKAVIYTVVVPQHWDRVHAAADKWAKANGYVAPKDNECFFKRDKGLFEIRVLPANTGPQRGGTEIYMYWSSEIPEHPVAMGAY